VQRNVCLEHRRATSIARRRLTLTTGEMVDAAARAAAASAATSAADAAYWDSTAPSALEFALSGPGIAAFALAFVAVGAMLAAYADIGPRRDEFATRGSSSAATSYFLRISVSGALAVELPSGAVANLPATEETVLRETKLETIDALVRTVQKAAEKAGAVCSFSVYRAKVCGSTCLSLPYVPSRVSLTRSSSSLIHVG
jgi:hypothetical protein